MMPQECQQFRDGSRQRAICDGTAALPMDVINAHRLKWGMSELTDPPDIDRNPPRIHGGKSPLPAVALNTPQAVREVAFANYGPGAQLTALAKAQGAPSCELCSALAKQMDEWGVDGCRSRINYIVADMFPRVRAWVIQEKPWAARFMIQDDDAVVVKGLKATTSAAADGKVRSEIRKMVTEAIRLSEAAVAVDGEKKKNKARTTPCCGRSAQTQEAGTR